MSQPSIQPARAPHRGGFVGDFFTGIGFLFRGLGMYARSPKLMFLGLIPAVLTFAILGAGLAALVMWDKNIASLITPFADTWSTELRNALRAVVEVMLVGAWVLLSILLFTSLTLLIGQPFYEAISTRVEDNLGGAPGTVDVPFWKSLPRNIGESIRLLTFTAVVGAMVFLIGLIPVAGQIAAPILGAIVGGWAIALELTTLPFERRGLRMRHRRQAMRARRSMSVGFGVATFVCFLIPGVDILMMPAAVAGATLLSRRLVGQPTPGTAGPPAA